MPADQSTPLSSLRTGQKGIVTCVKAPDTELLRHLEGLGLVPEAEIQVKEYSPFDHNLTVRIGRKTSVLGLNITSKVFVEER
jgi:Fe2+ transport system protein FeoA